MSASVARAQALTDRIFPTLTPDPYQLPAELGLTPDQRAARQALSISTQALSRAQRLGWRLGPVEAVYAESEKARFDADLLAEHIQVLEKLQACFPECITTFDGLALLHHLHAVKLANGDRPAQALLAIEKALACKPNWEDAQRSRGKISERTHWARIESLMSA